MKYATAALAFAVAVAAQRPSFLNTDFDIEEGKPFTLKFSGCETSCTIELKAGPSDDLATIQTLSTTATGGSAIVTLSNVPSSSYAFEIIDNSSKEKNYSQQFDYAGTGPNSASKTTEAATSTTEAPTSTKASTTAKETTTESTTSEESTTTAESTATTLTTVRSSSASATKTASATSTGTESSTSTGAVTVPTTVPEGGAGSLASPMSLVVGAVAALLLLH